MPSMKTLFLPALCAASAIARPQEEPKKEYTPGRCSFHLHEDRPGYITSPGTSLSENNIEMVFKDGAGKEFYTFPKTDIHGHPNDYIIRPKGFDKPVVASKLETRDDESLSGWRFEYDGQKFDTTKPPCKAGAESGSSNIENHGYITRDYDCTFDC